METAPVVKFDLQYFAVGAAEHICLSSTLQC